jgi:hypothetical protein
MGYVIIGIGLIILGIGAAGIWAQVNSASGRGQPRLSLIEQHGVAANRDSPFRFLGGAVVCALGVMIAVSGWVSLQAGSRGANRAVVAVSPLERMLSKAHDACAEIIANFAAIPAFYVRESRNVGKGNEFYFAWPTGRLPGSLSASCIGKLSPLEITSLTVNGMQVR